MRLYLLIAALSFAAAGLIQGHWWLIPFAALLAAIAFRPLDEDEIQYDPVVKLLGYLEANTWATVLLIAVILMVIASWLGQKLEKSSISVIVWLAAIVFSVVAARLHDRQGIDELSDSPSLRQRIFADWAGWEWATIALLTVLALVLRLYRINQLLPFVHGDEGEMAMRSLQILRGDLPEFNNQALPFFATSFLNHPTLFYYLQAVALYIGGESIVPLRVFSAICGALCVPLIYGIGRLGWGWIAGLTAAWLLAISHVHIQFSRIALNNIQSVWFVLLFVFLLMAIYQFALKDSTMPGEVNAEQKPELESPIVLYVLLGLSAGLAQYMYYGSRLLPVIAIPIFILLWYRKQLAPRQLLIFILGFFIAYLPLLFHFARFPEAFGKRSAGVFILSERNLLHAVGKDYLWWRDLPTLLAAQTQQVIRFFIDKGDDSAFYFAENPGLDPVTAVLFWLGLGVSAIRYRRLQELTLLVWFVCGIVLAGILTNDAPNAPRLLIVLPVAFILAGVFLQRLYEYLSTAKVSFVRSELVIFTMILGLTLYLNVSLYFVDYARKMGRLEASTLASEVAKIRYDYQFFLLGAPRIFVENGVFRFMDRGAEFYNVDTVNDLDGLMKEHPTSKGLFFAIMPHRSEDIPWMKARYPLAEIEEHHDALDRLLYTTLKIPASTAPVQPVSPLK